ncbi:hypothetical protein JL193_05210 [Polaribacter batillariae]|uniref:Uncharacterized protein n=1 Tax=Polaribacter batillariae TaxID=2808900 RepID=A0ABX7T239_9FLAO|nr:hypothetical protein [Polaribacter batillariae]QTD39286.1 hypothetical protein JL193_05210 [Polaribacter batillariae]
MNNPFKKNLPNHKASPIVKKKVLLDISMIKRTLDVADKYVLKYPKTLTDFFIGKKKANINKTAAN